MSEKVKVSIGMPVYNGGRYLEQAIESLLGQTFTGFELIISDNASTDDTEQICRHYASCDARIQYHRNAWNLGAAANYNRVFELSRGEYFKWAAHDDLCALEYLERCVQTLDNAPPDVVLCAPATVLIDGSGRAIGDYQDQLRVDSENAIVRIAQLASRLSLCNSVFGLIRSSVLRQTQLIGRCVGADIVLLAELVLRGQFLQIPDRLFYRRIHGEMSRRKNADPRDAAAWFDPAASRRFARFVQTRLLCEQAKAIARAPIPAWQKPLCAAALFGGWHGKRLRVRAGRIKRWILGSTDNSDHRVQPAADAQRVLRQPAYKIEGSR